jgi:hypothetical protein
MVALLPFKQCWLIMVAYSITGFQLSSLFARNIFIHVIGLHLTFFLSLQNNPCNAYRNEEKIEQQVRLPAQPTDDTATGAGQ